MSFDVADSLAVVKTHLEAMSPQRFTAVRIGSPPKAVLPSGYTAVLSMLGVEVHPLTLNSAIEVHTMRIGIWRAQAAAPDEADALMRYRIVPEVLDALKANFTLDAEVMAIDWGGMYGASPSAEFDEEEIADKPYWTAHITLPLIVDSTALLVA